MNGTLAINLDKLVDLFENCHRSFARFFLSHTKFVSQTFAYIQIKNDF